jgi:hypothetical protein
MAGPEILAIHIMKTAGTSLRRMLVAGLGEEAVYPNDRDLARRHKGWYPSPTELVEQVRSEAHHDARVLIGHVPYVLADELTPRPLTVAILREPVARALSMVEHRRTRSKRWMGAGLHDLLDDHEFVDAQVRDYQTKTFAFDSLDECPEHVNLPLDIDDARFERALRRLEEVDVLGVVERLPAARERLQQVTGIPVGEEERANRGRYEPAPLPDDLRRRLEELTARDTVLYRRALELIVQQQAPTDAGPGSGTGPGSDAARGGGLLRRLTTRRARD